MPASAEIVYRVLSNGRNSRGRQEHEGDASDGIFSRKLYVAMQKDSNNNSLQPPDYDSDTLRQIVLSHVRNDPYATPFIAATRDYTIALSYAIHQVLEYGCDTRIAVIDTRLLQRNMIRLHDENLREFYLGKYAQSSNFTRASEEVLLYWRVPADAIIAIIKIGQYPNGTMNFEVANRTDECFIMDW